MKSRSTAYDILYIYREREVNLLHTVLLVTSQRYSVTIREDDVCVDKPFRPEWLAIFIVLLLLPLFTVVCYALQVHPSETPSIKNLEGFEAWKKVKPFLSGLGC